MTEGPFLAIAPLSLVHGPGRRRVVSVCSALIAGAVALFSSTGAAAAGDSFVDRPLTLAPLHFSADAGLGFGQGVGAPTLGPMAMPVFPGVKLGWGANLEAAVGLPFLGELGVRLGYRFGDPGVNANADHFARLFDPIVDEPGTASFANPEVRLRGNLFDVDVVALALETRVIIPTADGSDLELTPGAPLRVHVPGLLRIDTGVWVPIEFNSNTGFSVDVPVQAFFQAGDAFFGPLSGVRFNRPGGDTPSSTDVPLGVGGGYTLGGIVDLKVQVRTERINDADWSKFIGGGIGAGVHVP